MTPDWLELGSMGVLLLLLVLAVSTRPWWRQGSQALGRRQANIAAYRTRSAELEIERTVGLVAVDDAAELERELAGRLLVDTETEVDEKAAAVSVGERPGPFTGRWRPILAAGCALLLFASASYWLDGSWRVQQQIARTEKADAQVEIMVQGLKQKLRAQPGSAEGWALLGRSYFVLQRFADAADAYGQANAHAASPNPEWLTDEGEALGFANDRKLDDRPAQLFEQALDVDADYSKALWYGGLAAAQASNAVLARQHWRRLDAQNLPPEMHELVRTRLASLSDAPAEAENSIVAANISPNDPQKAVSLKIKVQLAANLEEKLPANATLFVFAKAAEGPPMPLAVQRLTGVKLPLEVVLDDSEAMTPTMRLSQFDRYVVTARLSASGSAQAASGDLQGSLKASRADAGKSLNLVIDSAVP